MVQCNTKYSTIVLLVVCMLLCSGCQSIGDKYVEQQRFDALSRKVDTIETQVNALVMASSLPALASGSAALEPPRPGSPSSIFESAGIGGSISPGQALPATANEKAFYKNGQSLLKQKKFDQAAIIFSQMLAQNPQGQLAPNARYWLGECHYASGRYAKAALEFERCALDYPKSNKAPDSLLKLSYSYDRLGEGHQAMAALDELLAKYPTSSSAAMIKSGQGRFSR